MGWGAFAKGFASTLDLKPAADEISSGFRRRATRREKLEDERSRREFVNRQKEDERDWLIAQKKDERDWLIGQKKDDRDWQVQTEGRAADLRERTDREREERAADEWDRQQAALADADAQKRTDVAGEKLANLTQAQQQKREKNIADYRDLRKDFGEEAWDNSAYHNSPRGGENERAFSLGIIGFDEYQRSKTNIFKEEYIDQEFGTKTLGWKFRKEDDARAATNAKRDAQAKVLEDFESWGSGGLGAPKPQPEPLSGLDLLRRPEGPASDGAETTQVDPPPLGGAETADSAVTEGEAGPDPAPAPTPEAEGDAPTGQFKTWLDKQSPDLVRRWNEMPEETKARLRKAFNSQASASGGQVYQQMLGAPGAPA